VVTHNGRLSPRLASPRTGDPTWLWYTAGFVLSNDQKSLGHDGDSGQLCRVNVLLTIRADYEIDGYFFRKRLIQ
jgi:hypothetical protein